MALTSPSASPSRPEKYCTGSVFGTLKTMAIPQAYNSPAAPNKPPALLVKKLLPTRLIPMSTTPQKDVQRLSSIRIICTAKSSKPALPARLSDPTKDTVDVGTVESVDVSRAAYKAPQQFVMASQQKAMVAQQITYSPAPLPPPGIAVVV